MNRGEFEGLKARFGDDVASWPAPFRREAMLLLAADRPDTVSQDERLDHLILEAAIAPTDERALARNVVAKITQPKRRTLGVPIALGSWSMPATAACMVFVLTVSGICGYLAGGTDTENTDALLALAVGVPPSELADAFATIQNKGGRL